MTQYQLYGLYCPDTDILKYIGITKNGLNRRLNNHLKSPTNQFIASWFNDLKLENKKPIIKQIKECDSYKELLKAEIDEIIKYKKLNFDLYNISEGGDINPMLGKTHSEEARKKISLTHKGKKMTEEQRLKRKELLKKLWSNPEWSEKVRKKMGYNTKGEKNPNWKGGKKESFCECGNIKSHKSLHCFKCRDISGKKNGFFGKKHSFKVLEKIKKTMEKKGGVFGEKNPNFKYKICKEELYNLFITQNKTIKEISNIYNCSKNTINNKLRTYNINKPKSNIYNLVVDDVKKHLNNGLNYVQIGNIYGCNNKIIHKYVKKHKLYVK